MDKGIKLSDEQLATVRQVFANDIFATETTGIVLESIDVSEDNRAQKVVCSLKLAPKHSNAAGNVMGGVMFTMADYAFAIAANIGCALNREPLQWVSAGSNIHYLSTPKGEMLTSVTLCIKHGHRSCLYETKLFDLNNRLIASVETMGLRV